MARSTAWSRLASLIGIEHPIIQAPMAGGSTTPELVAAVSNAGGLGSTGAAYSKPEDIVKHSRRVRELTDKPFAVNLFAPLPPPGEVDSSRMLAVLARYYQELGLAPPQAPKSPMPPFEEQVDAVAESGARVFSFTFGIPPAAALERLRARGMLLVGTATTVREAKLLEEAGVDAIVVQGSEAGGHRGTFAGPFQAALVGTMALVPQVVDAVRLPVVASGGIMDGRGIAAARVLGASGAQLGTAFLTCPESGISPAYKAALREARDDGTVVTRAFSGRPARGLANTFTEALGESEDILPFPLQHAATSALRSAAGARGDTRFIALFAGQGAALSRGRPAAELMRELISESEQLG
ncbi:nitronate monooxygenase family protein [Vitiosangium sp. GDMCC 1.1324]|uniref:NAD(P)H-dependent flavin oxidoreductase n=1 Tax=Vitiosangium sp. (strain GDMCC 1.1324) TaxID=2138576 RepID=UPI000D346C5D|nr:nitronate monooxygenase [Vitiosangium sp. GDMCC 1.1324]PTL76652.1 nitronate monooxygenase [Vitiosangium sp. GDMCC 1.1324]